MSRGIKLKRDGVSVAKVMFITPSSRRSKHHIPGSIEFFVETDLKGADSLPKWLLDAMDTDELETWTLELPTVPTSSFCFTGSVFVDRDIWEHDRMICVTLTPVQAVLLVQR